MRRTVAVAVPGLLVALAAAGCSGGGGVAGAAGDARGTWAERGPASYTFALTSSCGERALYGQFAVTVTDGAVTAVEPLDETATNTLDWVPTAREYVPTIAELLERIVDAPGDVSEATFDDDGVPTHVTFDPMPSAIDDEECYDLTDVRAR